LPVSAGPSLAQTPSCQRVAFGMQSALGSMFPAALQQRRFGRRQSTLRRCVASAAVLALALAMVLVSGPKSFLGAIGPRQSGHLSAVTAAGASTMAGHSLGATTWKLQQQGDPRPMVARPSGTSAWILPSVDKDVGEFHSGKASNYAWVQTSESMFIFALFPGKEDDKPNVQLEVADEGTGMIFMVEGQEIINGKLAHAFKPGSEVWMIEEAADGQAFVVIEADKLVPGIEWTSVVAPAVSFQDSYTTKFNVELPQMTFDQRDAAVSETFLHLQRKHAKLKTAAEGHEAAKGDMLTIDMQGYEQGLDGERGAPLEIGSATGLRLELGATGRAGQGLLPEVHEQLVGITLDETRDVKVTLGKRAGSLGGQTIICAMTCTRMQVQELPALDDEFARTVKRSEQVVQAGTIEGIPEEEQGLALTITLPQLRSEIENEITYHSQKQEQATLHAMLEAELLKHVNVDCEWATPRLVNGQANPERFEYEERLSSALHAVAEREGLLASIDADKIDKETWDELGTPKEGQTMAEVGKDPAREYQENYRKVSRKHFRKHVLEFLESQAEVTPVDAA